MCSHGQILQVSEPQLSGVVQFLSLLPVLNLLIPWSLCVSSRLPFRTLVRKYGCDIAFTPMIISESFIQSVKARNSDFTTNSGEDPRIEPSVWLLLEILKIHWSPDSLFFFCIPSADRPLVVQFAASKSKDFADAVETITGWGLLYLQNPVIDSYFTFAMIKLNNNAVFLLWELHLHFHFWQICWWCRSELWLPTKVVFFVLLHPLLVLQGSSLMWEILFVVRWAMQEGYGCALLKKPELLHDCVLQAKQRISSSDFTVSIKIRINHNLRWISLIFPCL